MTELFRVPTRAVMTAAAFALGFALAAPTASAQQATHDHAAPPPAATVVSPDAAAADARLQSLLEAMNAAKGDARFAAMAAVISELAAQRADLRKEVQGLSARTPAAGGANADMMSHMMGMMAHMQGMMSGCSMMQGDHGAAK